MEQQAQFASYIQRLEESPARTDQLVVQTGEIVARLADETNVGFNDVNAKINALLDSQMRRTRMCEILSLPSIAILAKVVTATAIRLAGAS